MNVELATVLVLAVTALVGLLRYRSDEARSAVDNMTAALNAAQTNADRSEQRADREAARADREATLRDNCERRCRQLAAAIEDQGGIIPPYEQNRRQT